MQGLDRLYSYMCKSTFYVFTICPKNKKKLQKIGCYHLHFTHLTAHHPGHPNGKGRPNWLLSICSHMCSITRLCHVIIVVVTVVAAHCLFVYCLFCHLHDIPDVPLVVISYHCWCICHLDVFQFVSFPPSVGSRFVKALRHVQTLTRNELLMTFLSCGKNKRVFSSPPLVPAH